jgi:hypothetical protein
MSFNLFNAKYRKKMNTNNNNSLINYNLKKKRHKLTTEKK